MSAMAITDHAVAGEGASVARWRRDQLCQAGFPRRLADAIGREPAYDVHRLITLVEQGCPPALAARIVAPLEPSSEVRT